MVATENPSNVAPERRVHHMDTPRDRFQVSISVTLVDPEITGREPRSTNDAVALALNDFILRELSPKVFASGRKGFWAGGKLTV